MFNKKYLHGVVYKISRTDSIYDIYNNMQQISECGFNTIVVWPSVYWWEEKNPDYPFSTGKKILKKAEELNLNIIMELAGQLPSLEYMPDFKMKKEYYAVDLNNNIEWGQPSFGFLNYFHPEVNNIICEHFSETAKAYKGFDSLIAYDIFNDTMFRSFDKYTVLEFQCWLEKKYKTIERLNDVWDRTYSSFSEVNYQQWKWASIMPEVDYAIFKKESIGLIVSKWKDSVKSIDSHITIIADNIHSQISLAGDYNRPQDDYGLYENVDAIGMSFYPKSINGTFEPAMRWQIFDGMNAASKRNGFILSEMQTHIQALFNPTTAVSPKELKLWCYEAISHGASGLIYWMWKPFTKGLQTLGRGLVDYKNRSTERLECAKEINRFICNATPLKPAKSKVGIVYEPLCEDFQRQYTKAYPIDDNIYLKSIFGAFKALFDANIPCEIIRLDEIEEYRAVILSNHIVLSDGDCNKINRFAKNGGTVICDGKFGVVNEYSELLSNIPGGTVKTGLDYIDTDCNDLDFTYKGINISGYYSRDICKNESSEVLSVFSDGNCAVASNRIGTGKIININTHLFYGYCERSTKGVVTLLKQIAKENNLNMYSISDDRLKVKLLEGKEVSSALVFNYTNVPITASIEVNNHRKKISVNSYDVTYCTWR